MPVDLTEAAQGAIESMVPIVEERKQELSTTLPPPNTVLVEGDFARLTQVVENLLSNATKYTEEGGKMELSIETEAELVRLRVRDSGIGIDPELLPHIFQLFTQEPRSLDRSEGGLGLGLPLVERVVELHGGTVEASSPGRGEGSEFLVTLPRMAERRAGEEEPAGKAAPAEPSRILVVDDEEDSAIALAEILTSKGHDSLAVHDGPSALEAVREFQPDVVLLDLGPPRMNGYEVAQKLRDEHGSDGFLLIALTGYQEDTDRLREAGFDRHLLKPPDMQKLFAWLTTSPQARA